MLSLYLACTDDERESLSAELYDLGTLGILELPSGLRAWFHEGADLSGLVRRYDGALTHDDSTDEEWIRRTEESFQPFAVGQRFWIAAPWNDKAVPSGRMRLEMTPGAAFGTGRHECTQLCIEALEQVVTPGCTVLDVGTGSGILSVAARMLDAGIVISCDVDDEATPLALQRLESATVYTGSADAAASEKFDVVVANISPEVIRAILHEFKRVLKPGGTLILSGFPEYPLDEAPADLRRRGEWLCAIVRSSEGSAQN